ncbi:S-adenosyl-L-methionine-dependent methyltransferase [Roridomyces roridus]|uniref:DNA (cytosine-5-)-methyltransferase n=1 Tax=Roridomyces roridus TaxID=1738132 RepID=A0AAD7FQ82_9AGAR|nr:S-adenosyl-L-methionine-dependent methyltransferase [Roridomyces roridus]
MAPKSIPFVQVPPCSWKTTPSPSPKKFPRSTPFVEVPSIPWVPSSRKRKRSPSQSPSPPRRRLFSDSDLRSSEETLVGDLDEECVAEARLGEILGERSGQGLPVRRISDFSIFTADGHLVQTSRLLELFSNSKQQYRASGLVSAVLADGEADETADRRVGSLDITEFNVHNFDEGHFDRRTYIKTRYAWYVLYTPSKRYEPYWQAFRIQQSFGHLVLEVSLEKRGLTCEDFIRNLDRYVKSFYSGSRDHKKICSQLTDDEFESEDVTLYLMQTVDVALSPKHAPPIKRVPLIRNFIDPETVAVAAGDSCLTSTVERLVGRHFPDSNIFVVGPKIEEVQVEEVQETLHRTRIVHDIPKVVCWGARLDGTRYYSSVTVDGTCYQVGQVVAVKPGLDADLKRQQNDWDASERCVNTYANQAWFVRIEYFFTATDGSKKFHGQWLLHGSRTWFEEVAHSEELFLLNDCTDIDVEAIYQRCDVRFLGPSEVEKPGQTTHLSKRLVYNDDLSFTSLSTSERRLHLLAYHPPSPCENCGREAEQEALSSVHRVKNGISQHKHEYHQGDFVYVKPNAGQKENHLLFIARVRGFRKEGGEWYLSLKYYDRYEEDPRRIFCTSRTNEVNIEDIDGPCWVRNLDPQNSKDQPEIQVWLKHPDHFISNQSKSGDAWIDIQNIPLCHPCLQKHREELEASQRLLRNGVEIPVLELFAGAGGLSQGLEHSPLLATKWAVEMSVPAAETFRINHPDTTVLTADVNDLLRYCVGPRDGTDPLRSSNVDRTEPGDSKSLLPFTMLSLVEVLQPKYFVMENVVGLLSHSDSDEEKATIKLIIQVLIALGYQARLEVLQAGQYGSPQSRQRVIVFGAKRDLELPQFPIPTHAFPKGAFSFKLVGGKSTTPVTRGQNEKYLFAPHKEVTIADAIGDLPRFEWVNPHQLVPATAQDTAKRKTRAALGIRQCSATCKSGVGFVQPVDYLTLPVTPYQKEMRASNSNTVDYHYTGSPSPRVAELTASIPLRKGANHRDLSNRLLAAGSVDRDSKQITFGRLGMDGHFMTALTSMTPTNRGSQVLHPEQHRTYSVAEAKRAQGFPDHYVLYSDEAAPGKRIGDYYRQIGNAVPVPLAAALGRSLEAAIVPQLRANSRSPSPEL